MPAISYEQMQEMCEYIYIGLNLKEALTLLNIPDIIKLAVVKDAGIIRLVDYSRTKAKKDLLNSVKNILHSNEKISYTNLQLLQLVMATRFGLSQNRHELRQRDRQHRESLAHKEKVLRQWADYHATRLVNDASPHELDEYNKI
jgi:hypothetical protein